jgi:REP element-mobilizing transposase RayT
LGGEPLFYTKTDDYLFDGKAAGVVRQTGTKSFGGIIGVDETGRRYQDKLVKATGKYYRYYLDDPKVPEDWWTDINSIQSQSAERIGYPTQKPEALLERVIKASSQECGVVADFFCGGGTTAAVAQRLGRRWIACDQSRVAVAITADRLARGAEQLMLDKITTPIPDFTIEHWGVYESRRLAEMPPDQFRAFVLRCFGAVEEHAQDGHATRGMGVSPMNHGQDARATARATAHATAHAALSIRKGAYLPHWTMEGSIYAVTFRLADSLPENVLEGWLAERENIVKTARQMGRPLSLHEEKRLHQLHSEKVERYLDAGHGACWMKEERIAGIVANALKHFEDERYDLLAWCVMPNHVHVVVRPREGLELADILHSWKSFSAKEANKVLGRKGELWQAEYYDHLIRDEKDFEHCVEYVLRNPEAARLKGWKWVGGTAVPAVESSMAVPAMNHGQDARATTDHGQDARATIHGYKGAIPVWVGEPEQKKGVTAKDVEAFANAVRKTLRYKQDNLRDGIMLAWAFRPDAVEAADRLRKLEQTELNFIRLDMIRIDSPRFREHVSALSTEHADYENFLTFVQPPRVEVGYKRIAARTYKFDVSETAVLNPGAKIINVQWDFSYGKRFSSTPGYSFIRGKDKAPQLQVQYEFPAAGTYNVACKVQDDMGGEGLWTGEIEVQ